MSRKLQSQGAWKAQRKQRGGAAMEFSFILPVLLCLTYSVFAYGYTFVIQQSLTFAAQQSAESAVAVVPPSNDTSSALYESIIKARAKTTAAAALDWMPRAQRDVVLNDANFTARICRGAGGSNCPALPTDATGVNVTINFPLLSQMFPVIDLPFVGKIPPLPATLKASGVVLLSN